MTSGPFACSTLGPAISEGDVVFLVQAGYHLLDAVATRDILAGIGQGVSLIAPEPPEDLGRRFRSTTARHREVTRRASDHGLQPGTSVSAESVADLAAVLVVRNDWGPSRHLVELARAADVPTVGWVEGVQDFDDVDTERTRDAYGNVDHVFTLGEYDAGLLRHRADVSIVGSERLWRGWRSEPTTAQFPLLANVNFTYGVQRAARRRWVGDVISAAQDAGQPLQITRHPADRGLRGRRLEVTGGSEVLLRSTARLVTRFSTVIYDALTLGVDVVYYNPHGERVPTFHEPDGAFTIATTRLELVDALRAAPRSPSVVRAEAERFLRRHLVLDEPRPTVRAADRLGEIAALKG